MVKKNIGNNKLVDLFNNKKSRGLMVALLVLPFLVIIGIFGYNTYKRVKDVLNTVTGETVIRDENKIVGYDYILRDNATEYQKAIFLELKNALEGVVEEGTTALDDAAIAGLVCKNYVADFYTWTNKQGQYDVGGMYYIYNGEFENSDHFRENVYQNARYNFYTYLSTYKTKYGASNLLEVENVEVTSSTKVPNAVISEHIENRQDENGEWYDYREDKTYDSYEVVCNWSYKQNEKFSTSNYPTSMHFFVIKNGGFYIVAADKNKIDLSKKPVVEETGAIE